MKKLTSKIILAAITVLAYPRNILGSSSVNSQITGGVAPPPPEHIYLTLIERVLGWVLLPLGILAVIFYALYLYTKKRKNKAKKSYLYLALVLALLFLAVYASAAFVLPLFE